MIKAWLSGHKDALNLFTLEKVAGATWYIGFFILCFINCFGDIAFVDSLRVTWELVRDVLGSCALACLIIKIIVQRSNPRALILGGLLIATGLIVRFNSGDSTVLFIGLIALSSDGIRLEAASKILIFNICLTIAISILLKTLSLTKDTDIIDLRAILGIRFSAGLVHPNVLGKLIVSLSASYLLVTKKRNLMGAALLVMSLLVAYFLANSRTASAAVLALLIIYLLRRSRWFISPKWRLAFGLLLSIGFVGSMLLMVFYNSANEAMAILNALLSHRPEFWSSFFNYYGANLFGSRLMSGAVLNMNGLDAQLDGSYAVTIIQYGLVSAAIVYIYLIRFAMTTEASYESCCFLSVSCVFLLVGLMESYAFSSIYNITLIAIGCFIRGVSLSSLYGSRSNAFIQGGK